ncbi:uncharacterized protein LOC143296321 [Babylonia areolata]|uniref:uncharacterized protein LOC143296321 n=1 Tax=Babylonia areolata TaxID=304850 RepID=UPI003FD42F5E
MWTAILLVTLALSAVTQAQDGTVQTADADCDNGERPPQEVREMPSEFDMDRALERADEQLQALVKKNGYGNVTINAARNDSKSAEFQAVHVYRRCCEKKNFYKCKSVPRRMYYVRYYYYYCHVILSFPFRPVYHRCTCRTCLIWGTCPRVGTCRQAGFVYNNFIVYCHRLHRWLWLRVRVSTRCECSSGCSPFITNSQQTTGTESGAAEANANERLAAQAPEPAAPASIAEGEGELEEEEEAA